MLASASAGGITVFFVSNHFSNDQCKNCKNNQSDDNGPDIIDQKIDHAKTSLRFNSDLCSERVAFLVGLYEHVDDKRCKNECENESDNMNVSCEEASELINYK